MSSKQENGKALRHGEIEISTTVDEAGQTTHALPETVSEALQGDIVLALQTSDLVLRTMVFPTSDPEEIAEMVEFQIDKVSPFPADQLAISHEILHQDSDTALVLMVGAKHSTIDRIGDDYEQRGVNIHSIDARMLGWLFLLRKQEAIPADGCHILIIDDQIEKTLIILHDGHPIHFRALHTDWAEENTVDQLIEELSYTLTVLDAEHLLPPPASIQIWTLNDLPENLTETLKEKAEIEVLHHYLSILPPLSEGILRRTVTAEQHIELIPSEWIELQKRKILQRRFIKVSGILTAIWLIALIGLVSTYKVRESKLTAVQAEAEALKEPAKSAQANRENLDTLKNYVDRSDSALECLREVSILLPKTADIEFVKFNYNKSKAVTISGSAGNASIANNFFSAVNTSELFTGLKDNRTSVRNTRGVRRTVFSATLLLPSKEAKK